MFLSVFSPRSNELRLDPPAHLLVGRTGNANPARLGDPFKPRGDIDAVAEDIVAVNQDLAEVDAHAIDDAPVLGDALVALRHLLLHEDRALDRRDDGRNSTMNPSPIVLTIRPPRVATIGAAASR